MGGVGGESRGAANLPSPPPGFDKAAPPDNALHALGFEYTRITAREVVSRLVVTETYCQPFKMLTDGVSALIAELAVRIGGYVVSGYQRVTSVQLSINHVRLARLSDRIEAQAKPIQVGRNIQGYMTLKKDTFAYYNYVYFNLKFHPQGSSDA